jgi:succinate-semialdehyde dehydrogenase/glutarate-semialdehyde dehydrogenase
VPTGERDARTNRHDMFNPINPTSGQPFATYEEWPTEEAQDVVGKVHRDYLAWRRTGFEHRVR